MPLSEQQARRHVHKLQAFYNQVLWFLAINVFLLIINLLSSPDNLWFYWVTIFWGIGLAFNALGIYRRSPAGPFGKDWEERKIAELTKKK
jgi:hypothetical protein